MTLLDPRIWGGAILALVLSFGGGYAKGRLDGKKVTEAEHAQEAENWRTNAEAAYALYLKARDEKEIRYRTITKTVEVAKNETPDIPDCRTGDDWMRIFRDNAAIANNAVSASAGSADGVDARGPAPVRP